VRVRKLLYGTRTDNTYVAYGWSGVEEVLLGQGGMRWGESMTGTQS
jgi:hypothetical protein